jgi:pimeloyl-ACP methyl ester carboxylesterase
MSNERILPTLETAATQYVDAGQHRFAYRSFGTSSGTPLVFLQHFSGNMDSWDPAVVNRLSDQRPVVVFDNVGVGQSSGLAADNIEQMATDAAQFMSAIGLTEVDLLGYSLGGMIAQKLAADSPSFVRRALLVATASQGGEEHLMAVLADADARKGAEDIRLPLFFTSSEASQSAGRAFLQRATTRVVDRDTESAQQVFEAQAKALISWCATKDAENRILRAIKQPVLVVSASNDTMLPSGNAYASFSQLVNADFLQFHDSGHGVLFQYPESFAAYAEAFLRS